MAGRTFVNGMEALYALRFAGFYVERDLDLIFGHFVSSVWTNGTERVRIVRPDKASLCCKVERA